MVDPPIDVKGRVVNEKGEPLEGVTVTVKGTNNGTSTDAKGGFMLSQVPVNGVLVFSAVNIEILEVKVSGKSELAVVLKEKISELKDVEVAVSTGYQDIPKERATGSFVRIDNKLLNRRVGTDILDWIGSMDSGVLF